MLLTYINVSSIINEGYHIEFFLCLAMFAFVLLSCSTLAAQQPAYDAVFIESWLEEYALEQLGLAYVYLHWAGVPKDEKQAALWCRKAAKQGFAQAQSLLGNIYIHGQDMAKSDVQAVVWCAKLQSVEMPTRI